MLVKGDLSPPGKGPPRVGACRGIITKCHGRVRPGPLLGEGSCAAGWAQLRGRQWCRYKCTSNLFHGGGKEPTRPKICKRSTLWLEVAWLPVSASGIWLCCGKPSSFSTVLLIAKNMMKPELNVVFFLSSYSKHHELFTHETQLHFLLKRSFLLSSGSQTSDPPRAGNGPQGFSTHHSTNTWGHHCWLSPSIPTVPWTQLCPWWDQTSLGGVGVGAEMGHKQVLGQFPAVGSPSRHPCTPSPSSGSF